MQELQLTYVSICVLMSHSRSRWHSRTCSSLDVQTPEVFFFLVALQRGIAQNLRIRIPVGFHRLIVYYNTNSSVVQSGVTQKLLEHPDLPIRIEYNPK